jgi:hypothetical protein
MEPVREGADVCDRTQGCKTGSVLRCYWAPTPRPRKHKDAETVSDRRRCLSSCPPVGCMRETGQLTNGRLRAHASQFHKNAQQRKKGLVRAGGGENASPRSPPRVPTKERHCCGREGVTVAHRLTERPLEEDGSDRNDRGNAVERRGDALAEGPAFSSWDQSTSLSV